MEYLSHSVEETEAIGEQLGRSLARGSVVAYLGGLGMGKTAFTRGLARGLGCRGRVTSPTFTIVNEYSGPIPLFHFDMAPRPRTTYPFTPFCVVHVQSHFLLQRSYSS